MKIIFSHGKESGPWGSKIKALAEVARQAGFEVDSLDYTETMEPDARVGILLTELAQQTDDIVLVGSSMGGYVSLVAAEQVVVNGVFLLAPALYMEGYGQQAYVKRSDVEIVHGWSDDVIPPSHSIRYAESADCALHLIRGDHRLNSSLDTVLVLFKAFLARL